MKKQYQKPVIYMEMMNLSTHIASCGLGTNSGSTLGKPNHGKDACSWLDPGGVKIFTSGINDCETELPANSIDNIYCYNTPTSNSRIFAS